MIVNALLVINDCMFKFVAYFTNKQPLVLSVDFHSIWYGLKMAQISHTWDHTNNSSLPS